MAHGATMYRFSLDISDLNRHYYHSHNLHVAQHPSETKERMLVRVLAFALFADDKLQFTSGLCVDSEPELWIKDYSDQIQLWIDLGTPDPKRIKRAQSLSREVVVVSLQGQKFETWWDKHKAMLQQSEGLKVLCFEPSKIEDLSEHLTRGTKLHCVIEDQSILVSMEEQSVECGFDYCLGAE